MRIHIVTVGQPKLPYAKAGWDEYVKRLGHYHTLRVTHINDKAAYNPDTFRQAVKGAYVVALVVDGEQLTSPQLADFLDKHSLQSREVCFIIGGPEGLPDAIINEANLRLGLSKLTFPHDLAMVTLTEALYRASTINAGRPYHK